MCANRKDTIRRGVPGPQQVKARGEGDFPKFGTLRGGYLNRTHLHSSSLRLVVNTHH
jgi:hypothetical protein